MEFRLASNNCKKAPLCSLFVIPSQLNVLAAEISGELLISSLTEISQQFIFCSIALKYLGPTSPTDKDNLFAERFAANSTLDDQGQDPPDCPSRVIYHLDTRENQILPTISLIPIMSNVFECLINQELLSRGQ